MTECLLRLSSVSMSTTMEIAFDCAFCVRLLLLGSEGGASLLEASPDSIDHWHQYTKLGPFFASSFNHNFQPNNNQTFIVYVKSTLVLYRKGLCGFPSFGICPGRKVTFHQSVASFMDQRELFYFIYFTKVSIDKTLGEIILWLLLNQQCSFISQRLAYALLP